MQEVLHYLVHLVTLAGHQLVLHLGVLHGRPEVNQVDPSARRPNPWIVTRTWTWFAWVRRQGTAMTVKYCRPYSVSTAPGAGMIGPLFVVVEEVRPVRVRLHEAPREELSVWRGRLRRCMVRLWGVGRGHDGRTDGRRPTLGSCRAWSGLWRFAAPADPIMQKQIQICK